MTQRLTPGTAALLETAPLLWAGFLGLISLRHEKPELVRLALASIVPGGLSLLLSTDPPDVWTRSLTWAPFLLPGMAQCFERARAFATRRPERVLAGAGALLVLWNILFMEQYRRRLLPSDDTVSFQPSCCRFDTSSLNRVERPRKLGLR